MADITILCYFILCQPQTAWKSTIFIHDKYSVVDRPIFQKIVKCAMFIVICANLWLTLAFCKCLLYSLFNNNNAAEDDKIFLKRKLNKLFVTYQLEVNKEQSFINMQGMSLKNL